MAEKKNYKKTLITCYIGFITQAIVANFTPLLFLRFHNDKSTHAYRVYRERKKPKKQTIYTLYTIKRDYKVFKKGK